MPKVSGQLKAKKRAQVGQAGNAFRRLKQPAKTLANRRLRARGRVQVRRESAEARRGGKG